MSRKRDVGDGDSDTQNLAHGTLSNTVRPTNKSSTPVASGTTTEEGATNKDKATTNRNLTQGKESDTVYTTIGEDFHSQVGDGKVR